MYVGLRKSGWEKAGRSSSLNLLRRVGNRKSRCGEWCGKEVDKRTGKRWTEGRKKIRRLQVYTS